MKLNIYNWSYVDDNSPAGRFPVTSEELNYTMRDLRDVLLKESDWTVGNDSPLSDEVKQQWASWRQWIRDLPQHRNPQEGDLWVEIPDPPIAFPKSWVNIAYFEPNEPRQITPSSSLPS